MSTAREVILERIRSALREGDAASATELEPLRAYRRRSDAPRQALMAQLVERLLEYRARVRRVPEDALTTAIAAALQERGVRRLVVPPDLPTTGLPRGITLHRDMGELSPQELDESGGVLTGCMVAIAQTGTLVLDHDDRQGRRVLSLRPDYHLCVVFADQIVGLVPEAMPRMEAAARAGRPLTLISGPSATSDIELNRVEGVHGPRTLEVLVVGQERSEGKYRRPGHRSHRFADGALS